MSDNLAPNILNQVSILMETPWVLRSITSLKVILYKVFSKRFIDFGITEMDAWEENGLLKIADKEKAASTILALSEGFGILRNSIDDSDTLKEICQFMKKTALAALELQPTQYASEKT